MINKELIAYLEKQDFVNKLSMSVNVKMTISPMWVVGIDIGLFDIDETKFSISDNFKSELQIELNGFADYISKESGITRHILDFTNYGEYERKYNSSFYKVEEESKELLTKYLEKENKSLEELFLKYLNL